MQQHARRRTIPMTQISLPRTSTTGGSPSTRLRRSALALALVSTVGLTSCATIAEEPVNCGVIGSVLGGLAGGAIGVALGSDNVTGGAILGTTLGAGLGAVGGYQICKHPTLESAKERQRSRRLETSPTRR